MLTPAYLSSIHHDGSARYVRCADPASEPALGAEVTLRLRAAVDAPIERVLLRLCPDGEQQFIEMQPEAAPPTSAACRWWQASLRLGMPLTGYRFLIFSADGPWWLNAAGIQRGTPSDNADFRLLAGYQAPAWVRRCVFYQIFPDRFADGEAESNVRDGEYGLREMRSSARRWGEPPTQGSWAAMLEFYGGDLPGISQHLDYLADLGVNALYLNPIFSAYTNHRYDVTDYENVDPHLGGNQALAALRQSLSAHQMAYILDIVPNHCGFLHPWFRAACADANAPTAEYFTFHKHPDEYESWLGVRSLPKLNYRSEALRQAIYAGPEAVFRRWLRPPYAADGWRIDVANMLARHGADQLGPEVGRGIRQAVKAENPAAYLLGENFFDGSHQLQGDQLDATMNYAGFTMPVWWWLGKFQVGQHQEPRSVTSAAPYTTQALAETWQGFRAAIPWQIARQQFNLLGSHDTSRILTMLGGDENLARLAAALLMTYPGVPCIYYGDEIGMAGEGSLEARSCMRWEPESWNHDLRQFYQALVRLRRSAPALTEGGFQMLWLDEDGLAYQRDAEQQVMLVVALRKARPGPLDLPVAHGGVADGMEFREFFSGQRRQVSGGRLPLGQVPAGAQLWIA